MATKKNTAPAAAPAAAATPAAAAPAAAAPAAASVVDVAVVKPHFGLNLRAEPSFKSKVLEILAKGQEVEVREVGEAPAGWVPVKHGDVDGWVAARYVTIKEG